MNKFADISDEELATDIYNTELEIKAYHDLVEAFLILSNLPETEPFTARKYQYEHMKYFQYETECDSFLRTLYDIRRQRSPQNHP